MTPTLNIAALSRRTGVPADTIRKWEHRYGVLTPHRTPGGQRRYTERDVSRVEWLKARLAEGFRIGEAATLLGSNGLAAGSTEELRTAIVDATERSDVPALASAVDQALMLESIDAAFAEVFAPALVEIGDRWERGDLSVAQEHLASAAVRAALQRLLADGRGNVRGIAVLACAPGERHEVGLLMLAVLLRADGWQVAYLGADTPVEDAVALAAGLEAAAICFSAGTHEIAAGLRHALEAAEVPESLEVLVGGRAIEGPGPEHVVESLRRIAT